jgi:large subunit ribosomal protein L25
MEQHQVSAMARQRIAKGDNRRIRREGKVPAIVYGGQADARMISVDNHELELILRGAYRTNAIFDIEVEGSKEQTIIRDMQRNPVTSRLTHIDFQRIDLNEEIEVEVVLHVTGGVPLGVREGGVLEHIQRAVTVRCTPLNMPRNLEVDLTNLAMGQSLHVSDLALSEGVQVMDDPETALFTVLAPKTADDATAEPGAAQPEVIGEKKKEETKAKAS